MYVCIVGYFMHFILLLHILDSMGFLFPMLFIDFISHVWDDIKFLSSSS